MGNRPKEEGIGHGIVVVLLGLGGALAFGSGSLIGLVYVRGENINLNVEWAFVLVGVLMFVLGLIGDRRFHHKIK
jgi:hypothetical protein